ncbi:MAG: hypothetical protein NUV82_04755 [Candidatus Komeilibacteria bacterium]|nr:hypothetical protein [Candidatus Komeilibacteria bacterium]
MKINFLSLLLPIFLILLAIIAFNPWDMWMPEGMVLVLIIALIVVFAAYAGLVWRERPQDERDELHRLRAGRVAFVAGLLILVVGIIYQTFSHAVDIWLVLTMIVMIVAKSLTRLHSGANN